MYIVLCISIKYIHIYYIYMCNMHIYFNTLPQKDVYTEYVYCKGFFPRIYFYLCVHVLSTCNFTLSRCSEANRGYHIRELKVAVAVSHLTWVLGTKLQSSAKAARSINC